MSKLETIQSALARIDKVFDKALGIPPLLEEVQSNFPHRQGCSGEKLGIQQRKTEDFVPNGLGGAWGGSIYVKVIETRNFLACDNCGVSIQFR